MAENSWNRYDTNKLRHCHLCIQCEHSHLIQCVRLRPNSISLIRCGFVVQQALQQNPQQTYNKSNNWSLVFTASCGTNSLTTRSTGTVHTSAKARLTSLAIWIGIRIRIRIHDPDRHQNLIICWLAHCQHSLKISCKSVRKFFAQSC